MVQYKEFESNIWYDSKAFAFLHLIAFLPVIFEENANDSKLER